MKKHEFRPRQNYDPVVVLAALRTECSHPRQDQVDDRGQELRLQAEALVAWFENNSTSATSRTTSSNHQLVGDHYIHVDENGTAVYMETLPGRFGQIADPDFDPAALRKRKTGKTIPLADATPEEYLEQMVRINQEFKAGWWVLDATKKDGKLSIRTTVPLINSNEPIITEIRPWLEARGWLPLEDYKRAFYCTAKDLLIVPFQNDPKHLHTNIIHLVTTFMVSRPCTTLKRHFGLVSEDLIVPAICPFENGPVDHQLLITFLRLVDARKHLVISTDLPDPTLGAEELIDHRIDHYRQLDDALKSKAGALVSRMNRNTIKEVAKRLEILQPENWDTVSPASFDDSVTGPILHALRDDAMSTAVRPPARKPSYLQTLLNNEYKIIESESIPKVPRPELPCPPIEALRYLAQNPDVSSSILETAFRAFLAVEPSAEEKDYEEKETVRLQAKIADLNAKICSRQSLGFPSNPKLEDIKASCEAIMQNFIKIRRFRDSYNPGTILHPDLEWKAAISWFRYSKKPRAVDQNAMLELITGSFRKFWRNHHAAFYMLSTSALKKSQKLSQTRSETGKKGAPERKHGEWVQFTKDFKAFVEKQKLGEEQVDMLTHRDAFLRSPPVDPRTRTKRKEFLGTLITLSKRVSQERDFGDALRILQKSHIKAIKEKTIEECAKILAGE